MPSKRSSKPIREWGLEDMNHHDAAIREVLLIALEKHENGEDPIILTTNEVVAEVVRRGLREPSAMEGKKKGALLGSYSKRETGNNLSPSLFIQIARGKYRFNPYYISRLKEFGKRWRFGETRPVSSEVSRIQRVEQSLTSVKMELARILEKFDAIAEQVGALLAEERNELSFLHTSPNFPGTAFGARVTSIRDAIEGMIQRAENSIRLSTRQIDMFEDELIGLKHDNPDLDIVVISRGPEGAEGPRKKLAGMAFERMKEAGIRMYVEKHALHSRMMIIDHAEVLVSSADLDYTQMEKEFNAGIWTNDPNIVVEAIRYFDNILEFPTVQNS